MLERIPLLDPALTRVALDNIVDQCGRLGHHAVQVIDSVHTLAVLVVKISTIAVAICFVGLIIAYAYDYKYSTPRADVSANKDYTPENLALKLDEMNKSHQYQTAFLDRIEKYLAKIPDQMSVENTLELRFVEELLDEIDPAIAILTTEVNNISETKVEYQTKEDVELKRAVTVLDARHKRARAAFKAKMKVSKHVFAETAKRYAQNLDGVDSIVKEHVTDFLRFLTKHYGEEFLKEVLKKNVSLRSFKRINIASGIQNQGNSCWMNACIQSLFSSEAFLRRLDELEDSDLSTSRVRLQKVLGALKALKELMAAGCTDATLLGQVSADLRIELFKEIQEYNGRNILSFQDPASMYELLFELLQLRFKTELERQAIGIEYTNIERETQALFPIYQLNRPIQATLNELATGIQVDNEYYVEGVGRATGSIEKLTIAGAPPSIFVFRLQEQFQRVEVEADVSDAGIAEDDMSEDAILARIIAQSKAEAQEEHRIDHHVQEADLQIDMGKFFDQAHASSAKYRLVGFAKNISGVHYVSYGLRGSSWHYFNDANVTEVESVVGEKAHFLVYEKIA